MAITQSESVDLLPCDFCGGVDAFVERADFSSCYVVCNDCGAHGPTSCNENDEDVAAEEAGMEPGENAARRLWNTRPASSAVVDALREALEAPWEWVCPETGTGHDNRGQEDCPDCGLPVCIAPDWQNAETCIENVMLAYANESDADEDGPVDTVVSSGDLYVVLSLAGAAYFARARAAPANTPKPNAELVEELRALTTNPPPNLSGIGLWLIRNQSRIFSALEAEA